MLTGMSKMFFKLVRPVKAYVMLNILLLQEAD